MKVTRFFGAALCAVFLSLGMASCSNDDDKGIVLDDSVSPTVIDDILGKATGVGLGAIKCAPRVVELSPAAPISKIVIGSEGEALLFMPESKAVVSGSNFYMATYEITSSDIVIVSEELGLITIPLTDVVGAAATIDSETYKITKYMEIPKDATPTAVSIYRSWYAPTYTAGVFFDKLPIYGVTSADKVGKSKIETLKNEVLRRIIAKDSNLKDQGFKILTHDIACLTVTAENFYVVYDNGDVESSTWKWLDQAKGKLQTVIDGKEVVIDVRFEKGNPNKAYFVIDANCEGIGGLGVHTISGRIICTMSDSVVK